MTEKELRRLSRAELLEILIDQTKEISDLKERLKLLEEKLNDRRILMAESGSLAEASLKLNKIFADADEAAKQYIENARLNEAESKRILEEAKAEAERLTACAFEIYNQNDEEDRFSGEDD